MKRKLLALCGRFISFVIGKEHRLIHDYPAGRPSESVTPPEEGSSEDLLQRARNYADVRKGNVQRFQHSPGYTQGPGFIIIQPKSREQVIDRAVDGRRDGVQGVRYTPRGIETRDPVNKTYESMPTTAIDRPSPQLSVPRYERPTRTETVDERAATEAPKYREALGIYNSPNLEKYGWHTLPKTGLISRSGEAFSYLFQANILYATLDGSQYQKLNTKTWEWSPMNGMPLIDFKDKIMYKDAPRSAMRPSPAPTSTPEQERINADLEQSYRNLKTRIDDLKKPGNGTSTTSLSPGDFRTMDAAIQEVETAISGKKPVVDIETKMKAALQTYENLSKARVTPQTERPSPEVAPTPSFEELVRTGKFEMIPSLTVEQAEHVVRAAKESLKGGFEPTLRLDGLTELTPEVAEQIVKFDGNISLKGVTSITPEVAQKLAEHKGPPIEGIKNLHRSRVLSLGITALDAKTAEEFTKHKGDLYIQQLDPKSLSTDLVKILARRKMVTALPNYQLDQILREERWKQEATEKLRMDVDVRIRRVESAVGGSPKGAEEAQNILSDLNASVAKHLEKYPDADCSFLEKFEGKVLTYRSWVHGRSSRQELRFDTESKELSLREVYSFRGTDWKGETKEDINATLAKTAKPLIRELLSAVQAAEKGKDPNDDPAVKRYMAHLSAFTKDFTDAYLHFNRHVYVTAVENLVTNGLGHMIEEDEEIANSPVTLTYDPKAGSFSVERKEEQEPAPESDKPEPIPAPKESPVEAPKAMEFTNGTKVEVGKSLTFSVKEDTVLLVKPPEFGTLGYIDVKEGVVDRHPYARIERAGNQVTITPRKGDTVGEYLFNVGEQFQRITVVQPETAPEAPSSERQPPKSETSPEPAPDKPVPSPEGVTPEPIHAPKEVPTEAPTPTVEKPEGAREWRNEVNALWGKTLGLRKAADEAYSDKNLSRAKQMSAIRDFIQHRQKEIELWDQVPVGERYSVFGSTGAENSDQLYEKAKSEAKADIGKYGKMLREIGPKPIEVTESGKKWMEWMEKKQGELPDRTGYAPTNKGQMDELWVGLSEKIGDRTLSFERLDEPENGYRYVFRVKEGDTTVETWYMSPVRLGLGKPYSEIVLWRKDDKGGVDKLTQIMVNANEVLFDDKRIDFKRVEGLITEAKKHRENEKAGEEDMRKFDMPKNDPIGYIGLVDTKDKVTKGLEDDVKYFPELLRSANYAVVKESKSHYHAFDGEKKDSPKALLKKSIQSYVENGVKNIYINLAGHGSERGINFAGQLLKPTELISLFNEFQQCSFIVKTDACHGGGFAAELKKYVDPTGKEGRIAFFLQCKENVPNLISETKDEGRGSTYYNVFLAHYLREGKKYGEAHILADQESKKRVGTDAEAWISGPDGVMQHIARKEREVPPMEGRIASV